jgi:hypothetical protein
MTIESAPGAVEAPSWLVNVLLAEDDTEESVMGSELHQEAISAAHEVLLAHDRRRRASGEIGSVAPWFASSQVTLMVRLPQSDKPWQPKPDVFVVIGLPWAERSSYDTRRDGPMPQFVIEVASESTWRQDVGSKRKLYLLAGVQEYLVFDPLAKFLRGQVRAWRAGGTEGQPWRPIKRVDGAEVWRSEVLGLDLRVDGPFLRFDDPVNGPLPLPHEALARLPVAEQALAVERQSREAAEQERNVERAARLAAEERARAAEAALAKLRERSAGPEDGHA